MLIGFGDPRRGLSPEQFGVRLDCTQGRSQIVARAQEKSTKIPIGGCSARLRALFVVFAKSRQHDDTVP